MKSINCINDYGVFSLQDKGLRPLLLSFLLLLSLIMGPKNAMAKEFKILAFGDSLTAGYGLKKEEAYPALLETMLKAENYQVTVINTGVSGDTTSGGLSRLPWTLKQIKPDMVILALGANDALRAVDPKVTRDNINAMIETIQKENIKILLAGMYAPRNMGADYIKAFDSLYTDAAEKYNVTLYPFILEGVATKPEFNLYDGLHPNAKGAEVMAKNMLPYVLQVMKQ
jgi:acyl-CoA thioesterase-1